MSTTVRDNPEKNRFEIVVDDKVAGWEDYRLGDGVIDLVHTEIGEEYAGQGLAKILVVDVLAQVRERGLSVKPYCPYVRRVIERDQESYLDLVRPEDRAEFDLPAA